MNLITGGTGFLGAHICAQLILEGKKIRVLKRKSSSLYELNVVFKYYFGDLSEEKIKEIEFVEGDLDNIFELESAITNIDTVFHCAAIVSFDKKDKKKMMQINRDGTANLVNLLLEYPNIKLVYASSVAAIGRKKTVKEINEQTEWEFSKFNTSYAISKHFAEIEVWRAIAEGLNAVIVNPSVIIGVGDLRKGTCKLFGLIKKGFMFYTKGITGFVNVDDVAKIMIKLSTSNISSERFLISSENMSFQKFFNLIAKNFNVKPPYIHASYFLRKIVVTLDSVSSCITQKPRNYSPDFARMAGAESFYSNQKIIETLNFKFKSIEESVIEACNFYKKNGF